MATTLRNVRFAWNLREGRTEYLQVLDGAIWRDLEGGERVQILEALARSLMMDVKVLFKLPLRQATGMAARLLNMAGLD